MSMDSAEQTAGHQELLPIPNGCVIKAITGLKATDSTCSSQAFDFGVGRSNITEMFWVICQARHQTPEKDGERQKVSSAAEEKFQMHLGALGVKNMATRCPQTGGNAVLTTKTFIL